MLRLFLRRELLDEPTVSNMLTWQAAGGFSLDASVRIAGTDHAGRERLLRVRDTVTEGIDLGGAGEEGFEVVLDDRIE